MDVGHVPLSIRVDYPHVRSIRIEELIVRMAKENRSWGCYDRIVGALANLGHEVSDQTAAMFYGATAYRRRRSVGGRPRAQNSFRLTSRCWWELAFSQ